MSSFWHTHCANLLPYLFYYGGISISPGRSHLLGSFPPFASWKPPWICDICAGWPLTADTRVLETRYTCCDTETALTLTSVIMNPVKAIMTNCIFYEGSQKRAVAHRCSGFRERSQSLCAVSFLFSPRARLSQLPSRSASRHAVMTTVIFWRRNLLVCTRHHSRGCWNGYSFDLGDLRRLMGYKVLHFFQRPPKGKGAKSLRLKHLI